MFYVFVCFDFTEIERVYLQLSKTNTVNSLNC